VQLPCVAWPWTPGSGSGSLAALRISQSHGGPTTLEREVYQRDNTMTFGISTRTRM